MLVDLAWNRDFPGPFEIARPVTPITPSHLASSAARFERPIGGLFPNSWKAYSKFMLFSMGAIVESVPPVLCLGTNGCWFRGFIFSDTPVHPGGRVRRGPHSQCRSKAHNKRGSRCIIIVVLFRQTNVRRECQPPKTIYDEQKQKLKTDTKKKT